MHDLYLLVNPPKFGKTSSRHVPDICPGKQNVCIYYTVFFVYELTQVVSAGGSFARQQNTEGLPSDVTNVPSG